jgi:Rieske 2Fe-2S family protein
MKSMERRTHERLIERLRGGAGMTAPAFELDTARYTSPDRFQRERALFSLPRIVAASSAIAPGAVLPHDEPGTSALLARDAGGTLRAFTNACRHRATRLVDAPCAAKALVCPYHGWTYDLAGALMHAPHAATFGSACDGRNLLEMPVAERHGLVWLGGDPAAHLGALDADIAALGLADHVVWKTSAVTRRCNWKLVMEAFLDGYHIRVLHRDSVYRFFLDAMSLAEPVGPHIRAVSARRALRELADVDLRLLATPSFLVFPATTFVVHPDFVSILALVPRGADATEWRHTMLVPAVRAAETEHWDRSWELIESGVFQREDLWVCEQVQRGIEGGAAPLLFGSLELPIQWFHGAVDRAIG